MDCIFCKIVDKQIPASVVYEDEQTIAFRDIQPQAPVHLLVIPKKHIPDLNAVGQEDAALIGHALLVAARVAGEAGLADNGYRIVNNCGRDAGQVVFHYHWHVLGGHKLSPLGGQAGNSAG